MVSWNVTLFSLLVAASCLEIVLCGVQLVNAALGVFCGDCRKKVGRRGLGLGLEPGSAGGLAAPSPPYFRRAPPPEAALTAQLAPGCPPDPPRPGNKTLNSLARLRWGGSRPRRSAPRPPDTQGLGGAPVWNPCTFQRLVPEL